MWRQPKLAPPKLERQGFFGRQGYVSVRAWTRRGRSVQLQAHNLRFSHPRAAHRLYQATCAAQL
jgi:hypothetical protein